MLKLSLAGLAGSGLFLALAHTQVAALLFFLFLIAVFLQIVFRSTVPDKWRPL